MQQLSPSIRPDSYYEDASHVAISGVLDDAEGKSTEELRALLHRAYPFGKAHGRGYKIWLRHLHDAESKLGMLPKVHVVKHAKRPADAPQTKKDDPRKDCTVVVRQHETLAELTSAWPKPTTAAEASRFLRGICRWTVEHRADHDLHRTVLKGLDADEEPEQFQRKAEITSYDAAEREPKLIRLAQKMYAKFLELVSAKY